MTLIARSINTNTRKTAFWMLTYHNPSYIEPLRKETTAAFNGDRLVDLGHIHKNCPLLKSLWFETLRMASNATSVRLVNKDTIIGNKILRKGNRISKRLNSRIVLNYELLIEYRSDSVPTTPFR